MPCSSTTYERTFLWHGIVAACRCVVLAAIVLATIYHQEVDGAVQVVWQVLRMNTIFRHDSFEPFLSTTSFLVFISAWGVLDFFWPSASNHRSTPSDDLSSWFHGSRLRHEFVWYLAPLVTLDYLFPRRKLPEAAPSAVQLVVEVVGAVMIYDVVFFAWHATAHRVPLLYKRVHAKHHMKYVQRAPEAVRHTFIDGTMDVLCSIFALNVLRCHPMSRALYDIVIIWLITELHAGYDFPWQLHNVVPFGLLGGPPRHERHHREGGVYMQKFGTYLDEAFGYVPSRERLSAKSTRKKTLTAPTTSTSSIEEDAPGKPEPPRFREAGSVISKRSFEDRETG